MKKWVGRHASFPPRRSVNWIGQVNPTDNADLILFHKLEKKNSTGCLLKTNWHTILVKLQCLVLELLFISYFVFRRQPAEFILSQTNRQMKAGQYKIHLTNPVKTL